MKDYGYRLKVKIGKRWYHGLKTYQSKEEAEIRMLELIKLGHSKTGIKVQHELF